MRISNEDKSHILSPVNLYPNPVSDICYIENENNEVIKNVYDMSGRRILSFNGNINQFSCNTLRKNPYFVLIETENGIKKHKLIKR
ncbi:MAG: T9SS type A sorting domain-containing protein [Bacteroidales bacterium]|nr:T9SS type A sorting domain-containing protein [Bacteroidales bacterium]